MPLLLDFLAERYGDTVTAEDLFAYLGAVLSHPGYASTFAADLAVPGLRVPLTANPQVFRRAAAIGKRVLWLHSYGQRFPDSADNRPKQPPRLPHDRAPNVLGGYPIPGDPEHMPDALGYDPESRELSVGRGRIGNVMPRMREYDVSGVNVLNKWFGYRRRSREHPSMANRRSSPLKQIQAMAWRADYTSELIDLLNVLGLLADLEPEQAELLARIIGGPVISVDDLTGAHVLPVSAEARTPPKAHVAIRSPDEFWLLRPRAGPPELTALNWVITRCITRPLPRTERVG